MPLLVFGAVCTASLFGTLHFAGFAIGPEHVAATLYFLLLTVGLHAWQERAVIDRPKVFVQRFMVGLVVKMFASLLVVLILILTLPKPRLLPFVVPFVALYFAFLAFSTVRTTRLIKNARR